MDTEQLVDAFASKVRVAIRSDNNSQRLRELESRPGRDYHLRLNLFFRGILLRLSHS